jgi:hypothetical protein
MLQERNGLLREYYCGNGLSPLPHTPHLEIQSLYYSEFLFYSNSSKCLNFSLGVIGDLEIEIQQWAFLVKIMLSQPTLVV